MQMRNLQTQVSRDADIVVAAMVRVVRRLCHPVAPFLVTFSYVPACQPPGQHCRQHAHLPGLEARSAASPMPGDPREQDFYIMVLDEAREMGVRGIRRQDLGALHLNSWMQI